MRALLLTGFLFVSLVGGWNIYKEQSGPNKPRPVYCQRVFEETPTRDDFEASFKDDVGSFYCPGHDAMTLECERKRKDSYRAIRKCFD